MNKNKAMISFIATVLILLSGCSEVPVMKLTATPIEELSTEPISIENNTLSTNLSGYFLTCTTPIISVYENNSWRQTLSSLVGLGPQYLNDTFNIPMCDLVRCVGIETPLTIGLIEYVEIGKREYQGIKKISLAPVFEPKELHGKIKVEMTYFTDSNCKESKTFRHIFLN